MPHHPKHAQHSGYGRLLSDIKLRVRAAQVRAGLAANRELLSLYWDIGRMILFRQKSEGWGSKVIDRLSKDLRRAFPRQQGFSPRNLKYMRAFAEAWPENSFVQRAVAQIAAAGKNNRKLAAGAEERQAASIAQRPVAPLPWGHQIVLLDKLETAPERLWYAGQAMEHGWSRDILALQIDSALHRRQGKAISNFAATLPSPQSELAQQITKDPYLFDFLSLRDDANERAVEVGLLAHAEKFLLELGVGFALVGRQVHMEIGEKDFYLDHLFYHLKLRCFVVVDLKVREFTPEAAGKMNFYLSSVDAHFRQSSDRPSIGLILCRARNRVIAEYALRDVGKPIGVSGYVTRLVESLPKPLSDAVPSAREIARGLAEVPAIVKKSKARKRKGRS